MPVGSSPVDGRGLFAKRPRGGMCFWAAKMADGEGDETASRHEELVKILACGVVNSGGAQGE